jgi:peroxiredoxin Q/BCP
MTMKSMTCTLAVVVSLAVPGLARQTPRKIDVSVLGPQTGQTIPDFRLKDAQGKVWTRESIMGPNGAMLVFSRSLDWCPYCKTQVIELQSRVEELEKKGLGLAVITYDPPEVMADFARRRGITFPLLSDPGSATIKAYGILNTTVEAGSRSDGIPFPGTFLVDRSGTVTSRFFEEAYQERNTISTIFIALGEARTPATAKRIQTDHLDITTYLSDEVVAPGSLFSVVFDVTPHAGIHVYAPGAENYSVIDFRPDANPILTNRPLQYPDSEIYHFVPLDERVPVFQKPFRLVQHMALSTSSEARAALKGVETLTITGTLEYQACDDKLCFAPRSIPVSYDVRLRQLDTERATVSP